MASPAGKINNDVRQKDVLRQHKYGVTFHAQKECDICKKPFTMIRRRHHCRSCGNSVCASCSSGSALVHGSAKPKRVCDDCKLGTVRFSVAAPRPPSNHETEFKPAEIYSSEAHRMLQSASFRTLHTSRQEDSGSDDNVEVSVPSEGPALETPLTDIAATANDTFTRDFWAGVDYEKHLGRAVSLRRCVLSKRGHFRKNFTRRLFFFDPVSIQYFKLTCVQGDILSGPLADMAKPSGIIIINTIGSIQLLRGRDATVKATDTGKMMKFTMPTEYGIVLNCAEKMAGKKYVLACDSASQRENILLTILTNIRMDSAVPCRYMAKGCTKLPLGDAQESHERTCDYSIAPCPLQCGEEMERHLFGKHMDIVCPKREVVCSLCQSLQKVAWDALPEHQQLECPRRTIGCMLHGDEGCDWQGPADEEKTHRLSCVFRIVECRNGCSINNLQEKEREMHEKGSCPIWRLATSAEFLILHGQGFSRNPSDHKTLFRTRLKDGVVRVGAPKGHVLQSRSDQLRIEFEKDTKLKSLEDGDVEVSVTVFGATSEWRKAATIVKAPVLHESYKKLARNATVIRVQGSHFAPHSCNGHPVQYRYSPNSVELFDDNPDGVVIEQDHARDRAGEASAASDKPSSIRHRRSSKLIKCSVLDASDTWIECDLQPILEAATRGKQPWLKETSYLGKLQAVIRSYGGPSNNGIAVTIADVVDPPAIEPNATKVAVNAPQLVIRGSDFDPLPSGNIVELRAGNNIKPTMVTVLSVRSDGTQMTVALTDTSSAQFLSDSNGNEDLFAKIRCHGGHSGAEVQVARLLKAPKLMPRHDGDGALQRVSITCNQLSICGQHFGRVCKETTRFASAKTLRMNTVELVDADDAILCSMHIINIMYLPEDQETNCHMEVLDERSGGVWRQITPETEFTDTAGDPTMSLVCKLDGFKSFGEANIPLGQLKVRVSYADGTSEAGMFTIVPNPLIIAKNDHYGNFMRITSNTETIALDGDFFANEGDIQGNDICLYIGDAGAEDEVKAAWVRKENSKFVGGKRVTQLGEGIMTESRPDGFQVIELTSWELAYNCKVQVFTKHSSSLEGTFLDVSIDDCSDSTLQIRVPQFHDKFMKILQSKSSSTDHLALFACVRAHGGVSKIAQVASVFPAISFIRLQQDGFNLATTVEFAVVQAAFFLGEGGEDNSEEGSMGIRYSDLKLNSYITNSHGEIVNSNKISAKIVNVKRAYKFDRANGHSGYFVIDETNEKNTENVDDALSAMTIGAAKGDPLDFNSSNVYASSKEYTPRTLQLYGGAVYDVTIRITGLDDSCLPAASEEMHHLGFAISAYGCPFAGSVECFTLRRAPLPAPQLVHAVVNAPGYASKALYGKHQRSTFTFAGVGLGDAVNAAAWDGRPERDTAELQLYAANDGPLALLCGVRAVVSEVADSAVVGQKVCTFHLEIDQAYQQAKTRRRASISKRLVHSWNPEDESIPTMTCTELPLGRIYCKVRIFGTVSKMPVPILLGVPVPTVSMSMENLAASALKICISGSHFPLTATQKATKRKSLQNQKPPATSDTETPSGQSDNVQHPLQIVLRGQTEGVEEVINHLGLNPISDTELEVMMPAQFLERLIGESLICFLLYAGGGSFEPITIGSVVATATITEDVGLLAANAHELTVDGSGFDRFPNNNTIALYGAAGPIKGKVGKVDEFGTTMIVKLHYEPGALVNGNVIEAKVHVYGGDSATVKVATVVDSMSVDSVSLNETRQMEHCKYNCGEYLQLADMKWHLEHECPRRPVTCKYNCPELESSNEHKITLTYEEKEEHEFTECLSRPVKCNLCGKIDIQVRNLEKHQNSLCPERQVKCTACKISMRSRELNQHVISVCLERTVSCDLKCGKQLLAKTVPHHQTNECPKRKVNCNKCSELMQHEDMAEHVHVCKKRDMQCPQCNGINPADLMSRHKRLLCPLRVVYCECGMPGLNAKSISKHKKSECPYREVECYLGCGLTMRAEDADEHATQHIQLERAAFIEILKRGIPVVKHGRRGKPHVRILFYTPEDEALKWKPPSDDERIDVHSVLGDATAGTEDDHTSKRTLSKRMSDETLLDEADQTVASIKSTSAPSPRKFAMFNLSKGFKGFSTHNLVIRKGMTTKVLRKSGIADVSHMKRYLSLVRLGALKDDDKEKDSLDIEVGSEQERDFLAQSFVISGLAVPDGFSMKTVTFHSNKNGPLQCKVDTKKRKKLLSFE
jgi:hypothetical protein